MKTPLEGGVTFNISLKRREFVKREHWKCGAMMRKIHLPKVFFVLDM
jgi:hypothetical protein